MQRFAYAPKVQAYLKLEGQHRTIDISDDIISGSITRRLDAMSEASLTLQNRSGRYTSLANGRTDRPANRIQPMDRISIFLSRLSAPMLCFSGYIDESPYYQLYPGAVTISASCTLKLLQHTYFDPGLPYMSSFFAEFGAYNPSTGQLTYKDGSIGNFDIAGNMGRVLIKVLTEIGNWPEDAIDIRELPPTFVSRMAKLRSENTQADKEVNYLEGKIKQMLDPGGQGPGTGPDGTSNPASGGQFNQTGTISDLTAAKLVLATGWQGEEAVVALAVAMAESTLNTEAMHYNTNQSWDVGLWQMNTVHDGSGKGQALPGDPGQIASVSPQSAAYIESMKDAATNAKAAYSLSQGGNNFNAWYTYCPTCFGGSNPPAYLAFMDRARKAIQSAGLSNTIDPTLPPIGGGAVAQTGNENWYQNTNGYWTNRSTGATYYLTDGGVWFNAKTGKQTVNALPAGMPQAIADLAAAAQRDEVGAKVGTSTVANNILRLAVKELNLAAGANVETGGENIGPLPSKYQAVTGIGGAWCASFVQWLYKNAGTDTLLRRTSTAGASPAFVPDIVRVTKDWQTTTPVPGDIYLLNAGEGHQHTGVVTRVISPSQVEVISGNSGSSTNTITRGIRDVTSGTTFIHVPGVGEADPVSSIDVSGGTDSTQVTDERAVALGGQASWFLMQFQTNNMEESILLSGKRALANDVPLMEWITDIVPTTGRRFTTKPDGTFLAFYPDYFGYMGRKPYFHIADIEILDLNVQRNDRELATHVFAFSQLFFGTSMDKVSSLVASVEEPAFENFITVDENEPSVDAGTFNPVEFMQKFGARPLPYELPNVRHKDLLWMAAWMKFTEQWAKQYQAQGSFTFLPELLPGGIVSFGGRLTMFLEEVTHTFDMAGGFNTTATLIAPSGKWGGLPQYGTDLGSIVDPAGFTEQFTNPPTR